MYNIEKIIFNKNFYIFLNFKVTSLYYFTIFFMDVINVLHFLNLIEFNKEDVNEKKKNQNLKNVLIKESRVKKDIKNEVINFLNISEFVTQQQKEIYLNSYFRISFFLKNNLILQKNFIQEKFYFLKLNKIFTLYFMRIKTLGIVFFVQYRIYGLGFKIKKSSFNNDRFLRFDIGFGHGIFYKLPIEVKCLKRKRKFLLYSVDYNVMVFVKKHIDNFKLLNPYKIRGLKDLKYELKMKKGKKQSKK